MILRGYHQCVFCSNYFSWTAASADSDFEIEGVKAIINNIQDDKFEVKTNCPGCKQNNTFVMIQ